jgi:RNA polymerase sigma-70 factor (ECF subfamily)
MEDNLSLILDKKKSYQPSDWQDFLPLVYKNKTKVANPISLVEKVLISKLKTGDTSAFSDIFLAYYKDLVLFAVRFTHDLNSAEEIVQDMFSKLWEEHESVKIDISLKSYLLKLVHNKCIDWYRHKMIIRSHRDFVIECSIKFEVDTENYILCSELQERVDKAIEMLPEPVSEAFRMSRYKGLKYHEIADILGVSVRTIEVRIGKALHLLRNCLKDYFVFIICLYSLLF